MAEPPTKSLRQIRHDLRNELGNIRSAAFYIRRRLGGTDAYRADPRIERFFEIIDAAVSRAGEIVETGLEPSTTSTASDIATASTEARAELVDDLGPVGVVRRGAP